MTQEEIDEVAKEYDFATGRYSFKEGVKWCAERTYSEEEVLKQLNILMSLPSSTLDKFTDENGNITMKWFEKFKNK